MIAAKKGVNPLERGSQVHFMAEFQEILDFPPAPKLDLYGKLDPAKASEQETRGQALFFGKAQCATCHPAPYYTDNLMHNLRAERFFKPRMVNGLRETADGPIKTFTLRGVKDSPPYLHDGRLLTLDDTVEFFNIIQGLKLTDQEKAAGFPARLITSVRALCAWAFDYDLRRVGIEIPSHAGLGVRSHRDRGLKAAAHRAETHRPNWRVAIVFGYPRSFPIAGCSNNWLTATGFERERPRRLVPFSRPKRLAITESFQKRSSSA